MVVDELAVLELESTETTIPRSKSRSIERRFHGPSITVHKENPAKKTGARRLVAELSFPDRHRGRRAENGNGNGCTSVDQIDEERARGWADQSSLRKCVDLAIRAMRKG